MRVKEMRVEANGPSQLCITSYSPSPLSRVSLGLCIHFKDTLDTLFLLQFSPKIYIFRLGITHLIFNYTSYKTFPHTSTLLTYCHSQSKCDSEKPSENPSSGWLLSPGPFFQMQPNTARRGILQSSTVRYHFSTEDFLD